MSSSWEEYEKLIKAEMRKVFSEAAVEHIMNPRNMGDMEDADGFARVTGPCGDTMQIWLRIRNNTITDANFMTDGCGTTIASGSMATEIVKGSSVIEARKLSQQDILTSLGGLPEENEHCALLAANTIKEALRDYLNMKNEPWKKTYRKS